MPPAPPTRRAAPTRLTRMLRTLALAAAAIFMFVLSLSAATLCSLDEGPPSDDPETAQR